MTEDVRLLAGDCTISVHYDSPDDQVGKLRIDRADPLALMSAELLNELGGGNRHPDCVITDQLLILRGSNRTVVYRIGEYDPQRRAYPLTRVD